MLRNLRPGPARLRLRAQTRLLVLALLASCPSVAAGQPVTEGELASEKRAVADRLHSAYRSELAARNAEFAAQQEDLLRRYEAISEERRAEARRAAQREAELRSSRRESQALRRQKAAWEARYLERDKDFQSAQRIIAQLKAEKVERERQYQLDLAASRSAATAIVATAGPEKLECLSRFATGQRREAFPCIQQQTRLENEARDRAEAAIAAERAKNRKRLDADNLRATALLALEMMGRGDLAVEPALAAWQEVVATGAPARMDHLVLASLWATAADDVKALESLEIGKAMPADPEIERRYPLASYMDILTQGDAGSGWFALASVMRFPAKATASGGAASDPKPDPRLAPILEAIGRCDESLTAAMGWVVAKEQSDTAERLGSAAGPSDDDVGKKPSIACNQASLGLTASLRNRELAPMAREAMLGSSSALAAKAAAAGDKDTAAEFIQSGLLYCGEAEGSKESGPLLAVSCTLLRLQAAEGIKESSPQLAIQRTAEALAGLRGVAPAGFPTPDSAWAVPLAYNQAASLFEELDELARAQAALDEAVAVSARILETGAVAPLRRLLHLDLLIERARVAGRGRSGEQVKPAFDGANREIVDFLARHPNSSGACDRFDTLMEAEMDWRAQSRFPDPFVRLEGAFPNFDRCDRLDDRLGKVARLPDTGLRLRQLMRLHFYYQVSEAARTAGDERLATEALERVAALYEAASVPPTPTLATYHGTVRVGLGNLYLLNGDAAKAEAHFTRAIEVAGDQAPVTALAAWMGLANVKSKLRDTAAMEAAWLEKHRLCARRPDWESTFDRSASLAEQQQSLGFDIACQLMWPWEVERSKDFYDREIGRLRSAGTAGSRDPGRRSELQEALFYLGAIRLMDDDARGARTAFESSLKLGRDVRSRTAPFAMARLAELPKGGPWWPRLVRWLTAAERNRALSVEEQALLRRARNETGKRAP